jgi:hypothetical protein
MECHRTGSDKWLAIVEALKFDRHMMELENLKSSPKKNAKLDWLPFLRRGICSPNMRPRSARTPRLQAR